MRPMVPSPGHGKGCDGEMKAVKAGQKMGAVHQGLWPFVLREVFHEKFRVGLIPTGRALSCKEGPQPWRLCWTSVLEVLSAGRTWQSLHQEDEVGGESCSPLISAPQAEVPLEVVDQPDCLGGTLPFSRASPARPILGTTPWGDGC